MQEDFKYYMHQCLHLAKTALAEGNPPVGAVIVLDGEIIGTGIESGKSTGDITNHAEIMAIRSAIKNGYSNKLQLTSMYTTHEPCIMCSYMIRHHKIAEIVYGTAVPYIGGLTSQFSILSTEDIPKWGNKPKVIGDVCIEECNALNAQFLELLSKK
ncbi:tRNA(adenine34) deaminase [Flavobacterium sp. 2755]|uniref:nucleoside deaminase n=1 Tax=Flavobacterium sp. 2755 TaxID=2817765 RepID=UPI00285CC5F7|nr:nucleoside deaminase [Flavobacterium sp. 2755]MDR6762078.1 tRNA(adenine34) deaminase [Flavobacterium sp. 2755]